MTESPGGVTPGSVTVARWLVVAAVVAGAVVLAMAIGDEPYHIDELRQVRSYDRPYGAIVEASYAQTQPPLDSVVNATVQRWIGVGDVRQRLVSVLAGIGSFALLGGMLLRGGFGLGAGAAVASLAVSALVASITAYARPYALPLFLMLGLLFLIDEWRRRANPWAVVGMTVVAGLLPLSRTIEPPVLLAAVAGWILLLHLTGRTNEWEGSWSVPFGVAIAALIAVEIPVVLRLSSELSVFTQDQAVDSGGIARLGSELPDVLADVFTPLGAAAAVAALGWRESRRRLFELWWFPPLLAVPIGFALLFFLRTEPTQPYFDRYAYYWWPAFAVLVGALVAAIAAGESSRRVKVAVAVVLVTFGGIMVGRLATELTSVERADWAAVSAAVDAEFPMETVVLFDAVREFGAYRTFFAARPRYTGFDRLAPLSIHIAANPDQVPNDRPVAVVLLGARPEVDGWRRIPVDDFFTIYSPEYELVGQLGAARALADFGVAVGPERGAAMLLASAALFDVQGMPGEARESACRALSADWPGHRHVAESAHELGLGGGACES